MNYWICNVNRANWEIVKEKNIWGVSERYKNTISKVEKGDKIVFYIIREMVFAGIYESLSKAYEDSKRLFEPIQPDENETFPYRIKISPIKIVKEPIPIKSVLSELDFITNKKIWGSHFIGKAMRTIPKNDYLLLNRKLI